MSVLDDEREAEALAIRGVPAFLANQKAALTGVQPVDNLKKLIEHVRALNEWSCAKSRRIRSSTVCYIHLNSVEIGLVNSPKQRARVAINNIYKPKACVTGLILNE